MDNVRNIVKEIMRELQNNGTKVSEQFVIFYVRLLVLDPTWGISTETLTDRDNIYSFVMYVVKELENLTAAHIIALRLQLYMICSTERLEESVALTRKGLQRKLAPIKKQILTTTAIVDPDSVYKKLVYFCILATGLGNPVIDNVFDEGLSVLKSVLFLRDLDDFVRSNMEHKETQLQELTKLVMGIRLFNCYCDKGGAGIEMIPAILDGSNEAIKRDVQGIIKNIMEKVNLYTTALERYYKIKNGKFVEMLSDLYSTNDLEVLKHLLITYRQAEVYTRQILIRVNEYKTMAEDKQNRLEAIILKLHTTVYMRIAIPAKIIFPQFINLANIWWEIQDDLLRLSKLNTIIMNLQTFLNLLDSDVHSISHLLSDVVPKTDAERLEQEQNDERDCPLLVSDNEDIVHMGDTCPNIHLLKLEFLGFDPLKLAQSGGALFPGDINKGIVQYKSKYYAFSSVTTANLFYEDPQDCLFRILEIARQKLDLINLLDLQQALIDVQGIPELVAKVQEYDLTDDVAAQTEVHLNESIIDPTYQWNVWELKRHALKLADISKYRTVAVQTNKVSSRWPVHVQTYGKKEQMVQTKRDNYTNVPTPLAFIYGLRGRKDDKQFKVDLTRPVDE